MSVSVGCTFRMNKECHVFDITFTFQGNITVTGQRITYRLCRRRTVQRQFQHTISFFYIIGILFY